MARKYFDEKLEIKLHFKGGFKIRRNFLSFTDKFVESHFKSALLEIFNISSLDCLSEHLAAFI